MSVLIVGASRGLGRAVFESLHQLGYEVVGVSRTAPQGHRSGDGGAQWIEADLSDPGEAARIITEQTPESLSTVIYNTGIWEASAFSDSFDFLDVEVDEIHELISTNVTSALLVLRGVLPTVLMNSQPSVILTGSTSGLRRSGRPEVAFGASKFALNGIADALREGYRSHRLAVSTLQLGYLNTDDGLDTPADVASDRGMGHLVPVHDVVKVIQMMLNLSPSSFVREITLPAILDDRF